MPDNTFLGIQERFSNRGIHTLCTEALEWRTQLTSRPELRAMGGWDDALNAYLMDGLEKLADTLERVTYNPSTATKAQLEAEAADTSRKLLADYTARSINSDDLVMPPGREYGIVYNLTGADPNFPQLDVAIHTNAWLRDFVTGLDGFIVAVTRLTSRSLPVSIAKNESAMMRRLLNELYAICQEKGGERNRKDMPTGTLPSQEPGTIPGGAAQART